MSAGYHARQRANAAENRVRELEAKYRRMAARMSEMAMECLRVPALEDENAALRKRVEELEGLVTFLSTYLRDYVLAESLSRRQRGQPEAEDYERCVELLSRARRALEQKP